MLDDHELVRTGLRTLLEPEDDIDVVGEAGSVQEALTGIPAAEPDVAILDVRLPDGSGVEVCRQVRSDRPEIACLMLTSFADDEALRSAVLAGAAGYVLKQVGGSDLVADIRRVAAGGSLLDTELVARVFERVRQGAEEGQRLGSLTSQERRILDQIALGRTNRQIGEELFLAEKTVKNYVSNLLAKLGMERRTEAAVYATRITGQRRSEPAE